ncbi:hypothetical protein SDC9_92992 [bioreactor metagenome]|uniref:Uncharacterized protein n=1 Tax=bioreactor metagenome TaxID=1076179 RepID=A0A645A980_9ZZZZ
MNKAFNKYGLPLLIVIIGGWLIRLLNQYLNNGVILTVIIALLLFAFGISIQPKRRYKTWLKKLLIAFIFIYLILFDLGYFRFRFLVQVFDWLAIEQLEFNLLYLFLGWLFFD